MHQIEEDALPDPAIGDPQAADRPGLTNRVEDRAAAQYEIGALAANTRIGGTPRKVETREMGGHDRYLLECEDAAVDERAGITRQCQMDAREGRHCA